MRRNPISCYSSSTEEKAFHGTPSWAHSEGELLPAQLECEVFKFRAAGHDNHLHIARVQHTIDLFQDTNGIKKQKTSNRFERITAWNTIEYSKHNNGFNRAYKEAHSTAVLGRADSFEHHHVRRRRAAHPTMGFFDPGSALHTITTTKHFTICIFSPRAPRG